MTTAIAPDTIVAAMAELDAGLAVLTQRRQLLQQLLATWDDEDGETVEQPAIEQPAPKAVKKPTERRSPVVTTAKQPGQKKGDFAEVAKVIADGVEAGKSASGSLVEHYGVNVGMAGYLMKRCRELGYSRDVRVSFVPTPIERTSFDAQAARDAVAGPATGPVKSFGLGQQKVEPPKPEPEPRYSVEDALTALEAS